jgi:hypothetical protein
MVKSFAGRPQYPSDFSTCQPRLTKPPKPPLPESRGRPHAALCRRPEQSVNVALCSRNSAPKSPRPARRLSASCNRKHRIFRYFLGCSAFRSLILRDRSLIPVPTVFPLEPIVHLAANLPDRGVTLAPRFRDRGNRKVRGGDYALPSNHPAVPQTGPFAPIVWDFDTQTTNLADDKRAPIDMGPCGDWEEA